MTAKHYARWIPKEYDEPMRLLPDEVPADLLARLNHVKFVKPRQIFRSALQSRFAKLLKGHWKVVTRARFERATPSFGGWCSIQAELPGHVQVAKCQSKWGTCRDRTCRVPLSSSLNQGFSGRKS